MNNIEKILLLRDILQINNYLISHVNVLSEYDIEKYNVDRLTIYKDKTKILIDFILPNKILVLDEILFEEFLRYFFINKLEYSIEKYCELMKYDNTQTILEILKYE
jgi:hypothetical protein